jgi:hypothetical protein
MKHPCSLIYVRRLHLLCKKQGGAAYLFSGIAANRCLPGKESNNWSHDFSLSENKLIPFKETLSIFFI